ncbi:hypothetical protein CO051_03505 [Candidatus Roizmanbacteria bacterium CG_4_9_14_0_2_um_filter_39_13]|uniref:Uncharacterized protein n=1 Tax=Candidatus Roizmanbacteria bacterium CG_4_9_14_0_2_um_filter_39_13 TaxID=1974839 RepID=A0A2M8EZ51_9BACT|nr:MAG: hypothetical protein COY15_05130 [Candidatus Roizmanbacteria bacterium CG_4_10_14_0_2_um_filter_39_12]PJC32171.1 MAG: hypothetical protein CO051_03505 [Candidatus Roizmanbacteria bacterium CG_4_9_14_0_2_um_filter_39_13]
MKINNLLLPHPVLGRGDDVMGNFKVNVDGFTVQQNIQKTKLSIDLFLENKTLEQLISKEEALFNVEIECPATFYRTSFISIKPRFEIEIDKNYLRERVNVAFYITSNKKLEYKNEGANSDYENSSFEVNEGDVLGSAGSTSFNASILWEDLRRIFNIIKIEKDQERDEGSAIFKLNNDIIYISLSKKDYISYENYRNESDNFTWIYHASLVFPALIYALNEMMSEERADDYKQYKWFIVLDSRRANEAEVRNIWNPENIPEIAQIMIGRPLARMLSSIEQLSTKQGED